MWHVLLSIMLDRCFLFVLFLLLCLAGRHAFSDFVMQILIRQELEFETDYASVRLYVRFRFCLRPPRLALFRDQHHRCLTWC